MWGVNAVNGVINIISRHSRSQSGGMLSSTIGTNGQGLLYARAGGNIDADTSWKISAQGRHAEPSKQLANDHYSEDSLTNGVVDFRFDRTLTAGSDLSLWANAGSSSVGDLYPLTPNPLNPSTLISVPVTQKVSNQTLGARYRWLTNQGIESSLQASFSSTSTELKGRSTLITISSTLTIRDATHFRPTIFYGVPATEQFRMKCGPDMLSK
jgi:iron complex outermembrane receptor protein